MSLRPPFRLEALHEFDGINDVAKRDDYLRISRNELDRLSLLVDRVLSMSNIDRALPAAQKEIIPLTQLVTNITETLQLQTEKQHTRILIHQSEPDILSGCPASSTIYSTML